MAGTNQWNLAKDAFWRRLIREWRESRETRRVFCQRREVTLTTMAIWQQEIIRRDRELSYSVSSNSPSTSKSTRSSSATTTRPASTMATPKQATFVPVRVVTSVPVEIVLTNGRLQRVLVGVDGQHRRMVLGIARDTHARMR